MKRTKRLHPPQEDILYVLENLREKSHQEIFQILPRDPEGLARFYAELGDMTWCFYVDDRPAAILTAREERDGVWGAAGFGTDEWNDVWRLVTLVTIRVMIPMIFDAGAHRIHWVSAKAHTDTHKWLRFMARGRKVHEADLPKYGADESDFVLMSMYRE